MKAQITQLVRILKDATSPVTSSALANELNVSPRSVKTYIQEINGISPGTIQSSRRGYTIDVEKAADLLTSSESTIPQTSNERINFIIRQIISHGPIDSYDLCDEMYISYSTMKSELVKVRRKLSESDLQLVIQNDKMIVNGLEKNKRKLLSSIMYDESRNNFVNYSIMSSTFESIDIGFIKDTILQTFNEFHYFINDYSLENLILHVTITIDRIRNGYATTIENEFHPAIKSHEHELAEAIIHKLEQQFGIIFNTTETDEFTLLILSRASNLDYEEINSENLKQYIGEDVYSLAQDIIEDFGSYFYIDLSQPEFFVRFALHIKNLLVRASSDYFSKNPLTESIKQNCPLIYDASVNAANIIHQRTGIYLNDDEIAYIAFHIGGALEMQNTIMTKINVCIFCPNYYNLNSKMHDRIIERFGNQLVISNVITSEEDASKVNTDLMIATMQTDDILTVPTIVVSPFITDQDLSSIGRMIEDIRRIKRQNLFREHLSYLIRPELFEVRQAVRDKYSVIHYMAEKLKSEGYVGDTFEEEVIERDRMSSTAFGTFAIPHAMKMHEKKTGMNIIILKTPVDWDDKPVQLIMMLCFNRNERYIFNEVFEPLSMILSERDHLKAAISCESSQEFIDMLAGFLE